MEVITTIALCLSAVLPVILSIAIICTLVFARKLTKECCFKALQLEAELTSAKNELTVKAKELEADIKDTFRNVNRFLEKLPDDPEYKESLKAYTDSCIEVAHTVEKIGERVSAFPLKKGINAFLEAVKEDEPVEKEHSGRYVYNEPMTNRFSVEEDYAELMAIASDIDDLWTTEIHDAMVNNPETLRKAIEASEAVQKLRNMTDVDSDEPAIDDLAVAVAVTMSAISRAYFTASIEIEEFSVGAFRTRMCSNNYRRSLEIARRYGVN